MAHEDNDDDSELEIELRSTEEVAARMVILAAVIRRSTLELPLDDDEEDEPDSPEDEQFDIYTALTTDPLARSATLSEIALVRSPIGFTDEETALATFWQIEALAALASVVLQNVSLPDPWQQIETGPLLAAIQEPWDDLTAFARTLELPGEESIARERERAELWLWRCAIDDELRGSTGRDRAELLEILHDTVTEAIAAEILPSGNGDFLVNGREFAETDIETKAVITEIATQRLHALNWLCGFGASWDNVPLDV